MLVGPILVMSEQSTPGPKAIVVMIIRKFVFCLQNSSQIVSLISGVDPDVNKSISLYLISVIGLSEGFSCVAS